MPTRRTVVTAVAATAAMPALTMIAGAESPGLPSIKNDLMTARWRAHTRTNSVGEAVVVVELIGPLDEYQRTVVVTEYNLERLLESFYEANLAGSHQFATVALSVPTEHRPSYATTWATEEIEIEALEREAEWLEASPYFRIEGNRRDGYRAVLNTYMRETSIALNLESIQRLVTSLDAVIQEAEQADDQALKTMCETIRDTDIEPMRTLCRHLQDIQDHVEKQEQELREMERLDREFREIISEPRELMRGDQIDTVERAMRSA